MAVGEEEEREECSRLREQAETANRQRQHPAGGLARARGGIRDLYLIPLSQSQGARLPWGLGEAGLVVVMEMLPQRASGLRLEPCLEPG